MDVIPSKYFRCKGFMHGCHPLQLISLPGIYGWGLKCHPQRALLFPGIHAGCGSRGGMWEEDMQVRKLVRGGVVG